MQMDAIVKAACEFKAAAIKLNEILGGDCIAASVDNLYLQHKYDESLETKVHVTDAKLSELSGEVTWKVITDNPNWLHGGAVIDGIKFVACKEAPKEG